MKLILSIPTMKCAGCVSAIEDALKTVSQVVSFNVNLEHKSASVEGDISLVDLIAVVKNAGFDATLQ